MRLPLSVLALGFAAATAVHADTTLSFDFDSLAAGSDANQLATPTLSFHNAVFAPRQDADGIDIPGTERWVVDSATDAYAPITVDRTLDWGFGAAPSGTNALNAYSGPVLLKFDQPYNLTAFSATLDNSTLGDLGTSYVWFVSADATVDQLGFDATTPGLTLSKSNVSGVSGIVLQGGGFYDNISVSFAAIPEPSTYAFLAGVGGLGLVLFRRFRRRG